MDGKYHVGTEHIRELALACHALDLQFDELFNSDSICGYSDRIYQTYNRLLSTNLLNLAVSIRVSLRDEADYANPHTGISNAGLLDSEDPKATGEFSIKDICDKLIHADEIFKPIERGVRGACCTLRGTHRRKKWELGLGVEIFSAYILKWLDEIDDRRSPTGTTAVQHLSGPRLSTDNDVA